ncbi:MAG: nitroreductase [Desulfuromonas sp.]|nr:MAG: nitroreductase [Desulfuromonas sp.]
MVEKLEPRVADVDVDAMFLDRWSPRSFDPPPVTEEQIATLFEAARWSPSCYNDQPWLFCYAVDSSERQRFLSALVEKNRLWAKRAPLLMFLLARKRFKRSGKPNRHAPFDAGSAWMALALQARSLGLFAHAMAGFNVERAAKILEVDRDEFEIMAAIAVGRIGDPDLLPDDLKRIEAPNQRKPANEVSRRYPITG